jgi:hypothetical protein
VREEEKKIDGKEEGGLQSEITVKQKMKQLGGN